MKNLIIFFLVLSINASAVVWQVGSTHTYTLPSQVSMLVQNGDTVDIDAGNYPSDVCRWQANNLLLRGVGGFAQLESNGLSWGDKAIWVIQGNNCVVEWTEFMECTSTSQNGAGIRQEGLNLTVRHCYFHDNEDGILGGAYSPCKVTIEYCEFNHNGYGDGYSHNLYIGHIDTLVFRYNYSHHCHIGHELKSRAHVNYILYNRISNETTGDASREIDLPNGGLTFIIGNEIEQGPVSTNSNIIGYGLEGLTNQDSILYVVNNSIVNDRSNGSFLSLQSGTSLCKAYNNIFAGPGTIISGTATTLDTANNFYSTVSNTGFVNAPAYDYRLLSSSGAINGGTNPGFANIFSLSPVYEYVHPVNMTNRIANGQLDIGAHEYGTNAAVNFPDENNSVIKIYPNPSAGVFEITGDKKMEAVTVTDIYGRIVFVKTGIASDKFMVMLNDNEGRFNFVSVKYADKTFSFGKITVQK